MHYWASPLEAKLCAGQEVALVGAGNSAGQAAVYLASQVAKVWLLVRGRRPGVEHVALSRRPHRRPPQCRGRDAVLRSPGLKAHDGMLEAVRWRVGEATAETRRPIRHLFLFIGAAPNTDWLTGSAIAAGRQGLRSDRRRGGRRSTSSGNQPQRASSRSATCVRDRSSASPPPSARAPRWSPHCMDF